MNESIKIILILSNIFTTVEVGIGSRRCSSALMAASCVPGKLLRQHMRNMPETGRRRLDEEKSYKRNRAGISGLFLPDNMLEKVLLLLWRLRGSPTSISRIHTNQIKEEI
jgi:hypothetical protein